jgi:hypothetical protein
MRQAASGALLPRANAKTCPHPAKGDIRALERGAGFDPKLTPTINPAWRRDNLTPLPANGLASTHVGKGRVEDPPYLVGRELPETARRTQRYLGSLQSFASENAAGSRSLRHILFPALLGYWLKWAFRSAKYPLIAALASSLVL